MNLRERLFRARGALETRKCRRCTDPSPHSHHLTWLGRRRYTRTREALRNSLLGRLRTAEEEALARRVHDKAEALAPGWASVIRLAQDITTDDPMAPVKVEWRDPQTPTATDRWT